LVAGALQHKELKRIDLKLEVREIPDLWQANVVIPRRSRGATMSLAVRSHLHLADRRLAGVVQTTWTTAMTVEMKSSLG
jgi:hypothetical protein